MSDNALATKLAVIESRIAGLVEGARPVLEADASVAFCLVSKVDLDLLLEPVEVETHPEGVLRFFPESDR